MTDGKETQQQPVEKKIVRHKTAKRILRAVAAVAVVLFVLPSLLYIPGVQRAVKNFVVEKRGRVYRLHCRDWRAVA